LAGSTGRASGASTPFDGKLTPMNRTQTIATAVSGVVVIGLAALAAPAVAAVSGALSSWSLFDAAAQANSPGWDAGDDGAGAVSEDETNVDAGPDTDGLISAGNGTWFSAEGPGNCTSNAAIHPYGPHDPSARLGGELVDMGVSDHASGEVGYTSDGLIETYTVAPGDSLIGIGERFCVDWVTVGSYNDRSSPKVIQPGDVLVLRP
jgi:hypothetical protein